MDIRKNLKIIDYDLNQVYTIFIIIACLSLIPIPKSIGLLSTLITLGITIFYLVKAFSIRQQINLIKQYEAYPSNALLKIQSHASGIIRLWFILFIMSIIVGFIGAATRSQTTLILFGYLYSIISIGIWIMKKQRYKKDLLFSARDEVMRQA